MLVSSTTDNPEDTGADTIVSGLIAGEDAPAGTPAQLADLGEAKPKFGHLALGHADKRRHLIVGLGDRDELTAAKLREVAAIVGGRLRELGSQHASWSVPKLPDLELAAGALAEGSLLAAYRWDRFKSKKADEDDGAAQITLAAAQDLTAVVARAVTVANAVNAARDLQNTPPNFMTPMALADRAIEIAAQHSSLSCEVGGSERLVELGMGAFLAVAQGSDEEPALIVLRYEPVTDGPVLALVGKGVTFDSGGLSIKPAGSMPAMKSDMSGAAAVLEATAAIAALALPIRLLTVIGATENTINGGAMKPGDVVTAANGTTIEIDNTDAEGRMVLADCLHHATELGADSIVDVATLTGAINVALGDRYSGYFASEDQIAAALEDAARRSGEPVWRMPLDERYGELMKGRTADLTNAALGKGGGACSAAAFLQHFTRGKPWVHLDIAGTAYDADLPWAQKGGTGVMVRTLVELAAGTASAGPDSSR